jgi:hypothetical protein
MWCSRGIGTKASIATAMPSSRSMWLRRLEHDRDADTYITSGGQHQMGGAVLRSTSHAGSTFEAQHQVLAYVR